MAAFKFGRGFLAQADRMRGMKKSTQPTQRVKRDDDDKRDKISPLPMPAATARPPVAATPQAAPMPAPAPPMAAPAAPAPSGPLGAAVARGVTASPAPGGGNLFGGVTASPAPGGMLGGIASRAAAPMKKGGAVKKKAAPVKKMASGGMTSSASKRADGCAVKGKTKGTMIQMVRGGNAR